MKKSVLFVFIVIAATMLFGWQKIYQLIQQQNTPSEINKLEALEKNGPANFVFVDTMGVSRRLYDFKGKLVLINYWASWCAPCVKEFPSMVNLAKKLSDDLVIVAISKDSSQVEIDRFLKAFSVDTGNFFITWDKDGNLTDSFDVVALPETYILGQNLKLIRKIAGSENWDSPDAIEFFKHLIDKK